MFHWLHHLINPHCDYCDRDSMENKVCQSCETLKMQLSIANSEKSQLLQSILSLNKPAEVQTAPSVNYENIKKQAMPWNVRKAMLESEDRKAAQLIAEHKKQADEIAKDISKLEKEVNLEEVKSDA